MNKPSNTPQMNHRVVQTRLSRRFRKVALLVFVLPLSLIQVVAATYYVRQGGDDSLDGMTEATAWSSLAKVNGRSFSPGDSVLFRRGDAWVGNGLTITSSGTAEAPILFGDYGTGAKPVIDVNSKASTVGILVTGADHLIIQNLVVLNANGSGNPAGVNCNTIHHLVLREIDVNLTAGSGINLVQGGHILVDGCTVTRSGGGAIYCRGSDSEPLHDVIIQNCTVYDLNSSADGFTLHAKAAAPYPPIGANFILRNNVAYNCREEGFDITSGTNVLLENNVSYNNDKGAISLGHSASDVIIRNHRSLNEPLKDTSATLKISIPNVTVEYSTFIGSSQWNKPVVLITPTMDTHVSPQVPDSHPENVVLRNNVFMWNSSMSGNIFSTAANQGFNPTIQNLTMVNNVWTNRGAGSWTMNFASVAPPPNAPGFQIDHNLYFQASEANWNVAGASYGFDSYKETFDRDANGLEADPLFVDAAGGDFRLQVGSPAIDAGAELGLTRDLVGIEVPQGGAPDIGAYEFSVGPAAPTGLTATAVSAHRIDLVWTDNAADETAFRIQRKDGAGGVYAATVPATVGANTVNFSDTTGVAGSTTYHYQVRAENASGYSAWSAEAAATTPEAPLNVAITAPAHGAVISGQGITISASTSGIATVAGVTFKLDGVALTIEDKTAPYGFRWTSLRTTDGSHQLTAVARDTAGNTVTSAPVTIIVDNLPPSVALTAPAAGSVVGGANVQLTATATDIVGVAGVQFKVNGQNLGTEDTTVPYAATWDTTGLSEGSHLLTAVARDLMGRTTVSAAVTVSVDMTPPVVAITAPSAGATVEGTVAVSAEASDAGSIAGVQFKLNGANLGTEDTTAPFSVNWITAAAGSGSHTLTAVARDAAGNTATSAPIMVTVTVANAAPLLFEAELLPITATDSIAPTAAAGASGGNYVLVNSNGVNDTITYTVNVPTASTYLITTGLATQGNRGIFQLLIDNVNQGSPQDYYTAGGVAQFSERNLGTKLLTAGVHTFTFLCTGRNASAGNFKHALDYIKLTPQ